MCFSGECVGCFAAAVWFSGGVKSVSQLQCVFQKSVGGVSQLQLIYIADPSGVHYLALHAYVTLLW